MTRKNDSLGSYLRDRRLEAGLSLRQVALRLGTSHVFWGAVERGVKPLPKERWGQVAECIPGVRLEDLHELSDARTLQLTLREAGPKYEQIGELLMRRAKKRDLGDQSLLDLIKMLNGGD